MQFAVFFSDFTPPKYCEILITLETIPACPRVFPCLSQIPPNWYSIKYVLHMENFNLSRMIRIKSRLNTMDWVSNMRWIVFALVWNFCICSKYRIAEVMWTKIQKTSLPHPENVINWGKKKQDRDWKLYVTFQWKVAQIPFTYQMKALIKPYSTVVEEISSKPPLRWI